MKFWVLATEFAQQIESVRKGIRFEFIRAHQHVDVPALDCRADAVNFGGFTHDVKVLVKCKCTRYSTYGNRMWVCDHQSPWRRIRIHVGTL
ncbi:hypothetical protein RO07_25205 [Pandoraea pulmonicola]|uniref:SWIM-type domain-containing protein n=1 Tax=Pandoraea pulmonicola TaxID=93221 RepID=A0ABM6FS08_PANPU|nr:hypothetical protein RO07_25205 [Pandoraea pulmonicola]